MCEDTVHKAQLFTHSHSPMVCQRWEKVKSPDAWVTLGAVDTSHGLKQRLGQTTVSKLPSQCWRDGSVSKTSPKAPRGPCKSQKPVISVHTSPLPGR